MIKKKQIKRQNIIYLVLIFAIIVLANIFSSFVFHRFDLTVEKRYTLTPATVKILKELNDVAYVKVYLEGDLNVGFKRLRNATKELLDEFRVYAKDNVQYEFINPSESPDKKTRTEIFQQLYKKGLIPTNLEDKDGEGAVTQKIIFPGALISFGNEEVPVNLLKNNPAFTPEQNLNNSAQDLEYEFIDALKKVKTVEKKTVAFIEGHGELNRHETEDAAIALSDYFSMKRIRINGKLKALDGIDAIIIAKPDSIFSEADRYIIDQFIMKGGKALWLIDFIKAEMDSLVNSSNTMAMINDLGIHDQLFKYGVRMNPDLIHDVQCAQIPVNTAIAGTAPKWKPAPWLYFPVIISHSKHPVTKSLDIIKLEFPCSLDTVGDDGNIKKTILLTTSKNSKSFTAPARVSMDILRKKPDVSQFSSKYLPVAVLLEGAFTSVYKNRNLPKEFFESKEIGFLSSGKPAKMIIVSDGDIIRNLVKKVGDKIYASPLGTDKWFSKIFYAGNKEFIVNAMNYLLDDKGTMVIRSRELELRLLDRERIAESRFFWQFINTVIPVAIIILFGIWLNWSRKKKYALH
ncbi:MAG: gliding motility-associated ABC transporter substrate-binding protein GldG [Bacteroidia bacterium]|nr:gliding motility-associated ABC transporter substrate-binding protein GldG [Bacteroidia bacterium]